MLTIPDPVTKKFQQDNSSDIFGNISESKNIDFSQKGYLKLSNSPRAVINEVIDANWDRVSVILFNGDSSNYFSQGWDEPFSISTDVLANIPTLIVDANAPNGGLAADATWFDAKLAVSESTDLKYYDSSTNTWTDTNVSLTSGGQHPVQNFLNKSALAVCNINTVKLYSVLSATPTLLTTLTIPADFIITSAKYFNQNLYVGTRHKFGGKAAMYIWNGEGTAAQTVIETKANIIHDICVFQDSVISLLSNGGLFRVNGSTLQFVDAFPIYYTERVLTDPLNINLYHNIMQPTESVIYISFSDNDNETQIMLNQPAGTWCYDPEVGLYNKYSFSNSVVYILDNPIIDISTDKITVAKFLPTGTEVYYSASNVNSSLTDNTKYYVIYVDATHIKLATTLANANAGIAIDFTADDGVSEHWVFFKNIDYGQIIADRPSAMTTMDFSTDTPEYGVDIIWSGDLMLRDGTTTNCAHLGSVSPNVEARGYFATPKITSSQVVDTFNNICLKFGILQNETDKIIIKYRLIDDERNVISIVNLWDITWTSSTTFTSTTPGWSGASIGDEVNVLRGAGGGLLAHITDIVLASGTYTITIDEIYNEYTSGDAATATFRNWIKWQTISYNDIHANKGYFLKQLGKVGKMIQLKVELRGQQVKIEELSVDNIYKLSARNSKQVLQSQ